MTLYLLGTAIVNSEFISNFHFSLVKRLIIQLLMVPSVSACFLFCSLCLIGERAYRSINLQLQQLAESQPSATSTTQLDILMYHHEKLTDFMEEINDCFSFDLVIFLTDFILNLILNSYRLSWNKFQQLSSIMSFLIQLFLLATLQHKFFLICSCSQQVSKQVKLMRINLLSIQVQQLNNRDPIFESMLIGTAVMYASAALQYYWQDSYTN
ncbi:uncharacterized protein LOC124363557 [Homalodisca vitripennis]|uniref:uncharacterized protein LOC124363557 n=1 Tax=Homalodisca vitripennis TaxID=197043 RepID=UPI001EEB3E53|nr:uncharacterized protein LOC124363557 [Homalodisca vitripennis]